MNKEFRIGDIFIKKTVRGIPKSEEDLTENVQGYHVFGQNIKYQYSYKVLWDDKYLTRVDSNYPILAYTSSVGEIGIITESFYRTGDNGAFQGLFPRTKIKLMAMLYILACLQKRFTVFDYSTSMANIVGLTLELPVIEHADSNHEYTVDDIDWQYMEDRIKELEEDRIKELEAYLKATNLDDYELTDEDKKILSLSRKSALNKNSSLETDCKNGQVRFKEFLLGDLFSSSTGDVDLQQKDINGKGVFFINSGVDNHGIKGKTDRKAKIFPANTITIDFWGNAYYRDFEYKMATHNHVFSLTGKIIKNRLVGLYLIGRLAKLPTLFSYNNMATWNKLRMLTITLPVTSDSEPDFDYMERYIRAIEKLTIADVVKYKDKVIDTTKMLVNSQS